MTDDRLALRSLHRAGDADLGTAIALFRACVRYDYRGMVDLILGLDPADDDYVGVLIYAVMIGAAGLRSAEGPHAERILDVLAAWLRGEQP